MLEPILQLLHHHLQASLAVGERGRRGRGRTLHVKVHALASQEREAVAQIRSMIKDNTWDVLLDLVLDELFQRVANRLQEPVEGSSVVLLI